jgi:hypothetical protein
MSIISKSNNRKTSKSSEIIGNYFLKGLLEHPVGSAYNSNPFITVVDDSAQIALAVSLL